MRSGRRGQKCDHVKRVERSKTVAPQHPHGCGRGGETGGSAPRRIGEASARVKFVVSAVGSRHPCGASGFAHEASQGGEIKPDIRLKDESLDARQAKDRRTFEAPTFESGIA